MSSKGESASPGVSFSPGFLAAILLPGLTGTTSEGLSGFLGSGLAAAAFALSFSSFALAASCALVSFSILTGLAGILAAVLAGILAVAFTCFAAAFTGLAGAFLAGADLEVAAFAAGFLMGFAGFLEWDALVTYCST